LLLNILQFWHESGTLKYYKTKYKQKNRFRKQKHINLKQQKP